MAYELLRLPAEMRRRIGDFLKAIADRSVPSLVHTQLARYQDELDYHLNDLSPATLKRFMDGRRAEMEADRGGIWLEGGRRVLLDQIIEDHQTIARHFPLDSSRDRMIPRATLNVDAVDDPATKRRRNGPTRSFRDRQAADIRSGFVGAMRGNPSAMG